VYLEESVRQLRYSVAASLDGFIAGPKGDFDWIPMDPAIDCAAMYAGVSGIVMGRRSYEVSLTVSGPEAVPPMPTFVYSRTLPEGERDGITFAKDAVTHVRALKQVDGKPLWLWGGGELFRELAAAGLVDVVEVAVIPTLLGEGVPLLAGPASRLPLRLRTHRLYQATGIMLLEYDVVNAESRAGV
jgi:dihydrofolate reductase